MSIIIPANSAVGGGFEVDNSCRFNPADSAYMHKTPNAGNQKKFTFSCWIKRSLITSAQTLFWAGSSNSDYCAMRLEASDKLSVFEAVGASTNWGINTNRVLRDTSAWYHLVVAVDTTQGTASNRVKIYINGVQETDLTTTDGYPALNRDTIFNTAVPHQISHDYVAQYYGGYIAEACFLEGSQNAPTDFGEFDEDSAIWKPIDVSGLTFGTNGFYLDFEDSANLGNDANGGTDLTESGLTAVDQSTDTCTNNFATWNSLIKTTSTLSEGNLKYAQPGSNPVFGSLSTIGVTSGKWYAELNYTSGSSHTLVLGVADETFQNGNTTASYDLGKSGTTSSIAYVVNTGAYRINNSNTSWGSAGGDGQIINMAIDRDNGKIYFGVNGTWGNSSNPASNSGGIPTTALDSSTNWFWGITADTSGTSDVGELNFGSPSYAVSSGNADGNGYGNFEYAVPSGFFSICTKNLAEVLS